MKKTKIAGMMAAALVAGFTMTSCDKSSGKMDEKTPAAQTAATVEGKLAYVEVDSIMTQYNYCKEQSKVLEQKGKNIQKTLAEKEQALQNAVANFQQKYQNNGFTSAQQAQQAQAGIQKQQNDLQALNQRLGTEFQNETEQFNKALRDSIQHYLAVYNKDKKYALIFSKQGDNLLYADKSYDITAEVIAGLNKAYKGKVTAPAASDSKGKK